MAAALNVVEPMMSGVGGYGTILVYDAASRRSRFLNPSGRIRKKDGRPWLVPGTPSRQWDIPSGSSAGSETPTAS